VVGLATVPDPCRSGGHPSVPISAWTRETHPTAKPAAWGCRARSLPVWRTPIRADLGLASPSSPNEFELAKKGSPEVELGLEVVEPYRLVAEKILVAEITCNSRHPLRHAIHLSSLMEPRYSAMRLEKVTCNPRPKQAPRLNSF
jgi:hypothetical protein